MSLKQHVLHQGLLLFVTVSIFALWLTTWYVSAEHIFYSWDYGLYMDIAVRLSRTFMQDPFEGLSSVYSSTQLDYNYYFALPLIPFLELFGYSRLGFILALVTVYHLPMLFVLGSIVKRVFPFLSLAPWFAICVGLAIPVFWATVFRGLPDSGGVLLVSMAVLVYLRDMELKRWQVQLPLIGLIAGFSIILRRHFVYNIAAFLISVSLFLVFFSVQRAGRNWKAFLREIWGIVMKVQILVAFLLMTLVLFAPGLLLKMTAVNYLQLYSSYENATANVVAYFLYACGILWLFTGLGFFTSIFDKQIRIRFEDSDSSAKFALFFCFIFGLVAFLTWVSIPGQSSLHYVLHVALLVVLGTSAFFVWAWIKFESWARWIIVSCSAGLLTINLWIGLAPAPPKYLQITQNYPPLYREDYDEIVRLVSYLRQEVGENARIYVVDSSQIMNSEILHNAEVASYGEQAFLNIMHTPEIDSRDFYPLENLIKANYVVVTSPVQYHLEEHEQKVVRFAHDVFSQNLPLAAGFREMPERFLLTDGAVLRVYKREKPMPLSATVATFVQMKEFVGRLPGRQPEWISITPLLGPDSIYRVGGNQYGVSLSYEALPQSFLYVDTGLVTGRISGVATMDNENCGPILTRLDVYWASEPTSLVSKTMIVTKSGKFNLDFSKTYNTVLVLTFEQVKGIATYTCQPILQWEMIR